MPKNTSLHERHLSAGARMVAFAGWELPLHYGSQIEEHHAVRRDAGLFDVSHMTVTDVEGKDSRSFLRAMLANDVDRLRSGAALYSCMLNEHAGIVDDVIVYRLNEDRYRVVSNGATRERVLDWMQGHIELETVVRLRDDLAMIAIQGPHAREKADACLPEGLRSRVESLGVFEAVAAGDWQVARTGYTGEDGYEVMLPQDEAPGFWDQLYGQGVRPCGLGARDTLRLEAGMRLYGTDMDEAVTPLDAGLGWTVAWEPRDRAFIGKEALAAHLEKGSAGRFAGLVLCGQGVLRGHRRVIVPEIGEGIITSGGFSPTLGRGIGLARLPAGDYSCCQVEIRGEWKEAQVVPPRFVRSGRSLIEGVPAVH